jgi:hypothetical protein
MAIGDALQVALDAGQQAVAQGGDVGLFIQLGAIALAHVQVGGAQAVVGQQRGVEGKLGVFGRVLDAIGGALAAFGLVVDHQRLAVGAAVHAVEPAVSCQAPSGVTPSASARSKWPPVAS